MFRQTLFAMPETAIGLFPDVGSTYWMPRLLASSFACATYLALTGRRLKAPDLIALGLATHYVPSQKLEAFEAELVRATISSSSSFQKDVVAPILEAFHETPLGKIELEPVQTEIEHAFHMDASLEDIVHTLQGMDTEFSNVTLSTLKKMSPTSLKITLEGLKRGKRAANIAECLRTEFRMSQACMRPGSDFYEGIRAVLIDKNEPQWKPSTWEEVSDDVVQTYFDEISCDWEIPEEIKVDH
jgi:enoyl-CoA hydratase/carnithine racemase